MEVNFNKEQDANIILMLLYLHLNQHNPIDIDDLEIQMWRVFLIVWIW